MRIEIFCCPSLVDFPDQDGVPLSSGTCVRGKIPLIVREPGEPAVITPPAVSEQPHETAVGPVELPKEVEEDPDPSLLELLKEEEIVVAAQRAAAPVASQAVDTANMDEGKVTTSSHRKQYMVLQRVANGPRAADFPELVKMFRGTKTEKFSALRAFVSSGESLEAVESTFASRRLQSETLSKLRRCLTIREMQQLGCSTHLPCIFSMVGESSVHCLFYI